MTKAEEKGKAQVAGLEDGSHIGIHLLGCESGKGESAIIQMHDGKWGVIDCYNPTPNDLAGNGTLTFLEHHSVSELEFVCLTHPHDDHFLGMRQLFEKFDVKAFWKFCSLSPEELRRVVEGEYRASSGNEELGKSADDLLKLFEVIQKRLKRRGASKLRLKNVVINSQLYPVPTDHDSKLQITAVAPSGNQVERYQRSLKNCFPNGKYSPGGRIDHNIVSAAFRIDFGDTRIILGGDVEEAGWCDALAEINSDLLRAHAVKASHHGSKTGYCKNLWETFSAGGAPYVLVTPYRSSRLPRAEGLEHILQFANSIGITASWLPLSLPLGERLTRSRWEIFRTFKAREVSSGQGFGRCSLVYDDKGNCIKRYYIPPATEILPRDSAAGGRASR